MQDPWPIYKVYIIKITLKNISKIFNAYIIVTIIIIEVINIYNFICNMVVYNVYFV